MIRFLKSLFCRPLLEDTPLARRLFAVHLEQTQTGAGKWDR